MTVAALLNSGADIHTLGGPVSHQQTHMLIGIRVVRLFAKYRLGTGGTRLRRLDPRGRLLLHHL